MIACDGMQVITYKLLGPQVGEAHRTGKLVLGRAILTWHQRDAGRDLN